MKPTKTPEKSNENVKQYYLNKKNRKPNKKHLCYLRTPNGQRLSELGKRIHKALN